MLYMADHKVATNSYVDTPYIFSSHLFIFKQVVESSSWVTRYYYRTYLTLKRVRHKILHGRPNIPTTRSFFQTRADRESLRRKRSQKPPSSINSQGIHPSSMRLARSPPSVEAPTLSIVLAGYIENARAIHTYC